jgi:type VI secretion system VasD/TssJ family lipoprotein
VNLDENGDPLPTVVRLYQLKTIGAMEQASFDDIWENATDTLGESLVSVDELVMYPGQSETRNLERDPTAFYIVAMAGVRRPQGQSWRTIMSLPQPAAQQAALAATSAPGSSSDQVDPQEVQPDAPPPTLSVTLLLDGYAIEGSLARIPAEGTCLPEDQPCLQALADLHGPHYEFGLHIGTGLTINSQFNENSGLSAPVRERSRTFTDITFRYWKGALPQISFGGALRLELEDRRSIGLVPRAEYDMQVGDVYRFRPLVGVPIFVFPFTLIGLELGMAHEFVLGGGPVSLTASMLMDTFVYGSELPEDSLLFMFNATLGLEVEL